MRKTEVQMDPNSLEKNKMSSLQNCVSKSHLRRVSYRGILAGGGLFFLILYLSQGTTGVSDDLLFFANRDQGKGEISFSPPLMLLATPFNFYFNAFFIQLFSLEKTFGLDLIKGVFLSFYVYCGYLFFQKYVSRATAIFGSFLFFFYPIHDGATYFFLAHYLLAGFAFYFLSLWLLQKKLWLAGFCAALIASFTSYGSLPVALGITAICLKERNLRAAGCALLPNLVYSIYFFIVTKGFGLGPQRLPDSWDGLLKSFGLQFLSSLDANLGISSLLKIWSLLESASPFVFIAGLLSSLLFFFSNSAEARTEQGCRSSPCSLLVCAGIVYGCGLGILALTRAYPQVAFNLGNRVSIFGSFLVICILLLVCEKRPRFLWVITPFYLICILSASQHWKQWVAVQKGVVQILSRIPDANPVEGQLVILAGPRYSRLGSFDHLEGATERWVCEKYFKLAFGGAVREVWPASSFLQPDDHFLFNAKTGERREIKYPVMYVSLLDQSVQQLQRKQLSETIKKISPDRRHWLQKLPARYRETIANSFPRFRYLF